MTVDICACGAPRRPGGSDCRECHRKTVKRYRERQARHRQVQDQLIENLTVNNRDTREKFEARCKTRFVVVLAGPGEEVDDFAGMVASFHPMGMLTVVDTDGRSHSVPLHKVKEDIGRKNYGISQ